MASFEEDLQFDDDDAKADELPEDEYEGDASTGNPMNSTPPLVQHISYTQNPPDPLQQIRPKPVPPMFDANNSNAPLQLKATNASYQLSPKQSSTDFAHSPVGTDNDDIMAYGLNSIQLTDVDRIDDCPQFPDKSHSKTVPISMPKFWTCSICTFAENTLDAPVCAICGALPPVVPVEELVQFEKANSDPSAAMNEQNQNRNSLNRALSEQNVANSAYTQLSTFVSEDDQKVDTYKSRVRRSIAELVTEEKSISVLNEIPKHEQTLIEKQILYIKSKPELHNELVLVKNTVQKKIKQHHKHIVALHKQMSKLRGEHKKQRRLWDEYAIVVLQRLCEAYFGKLFELLRCRIQIETFYLQCFELKLEKVTTAGNKLTEFIDQWDLDDARQYVKSTMFTVSKIRTSPQVHTKKDSLDGIRATISRFEKEYESKKEVLNTPHVDHDKRASYILFYLKGVINEYNAGNENIELTASYFCALDVQETFNSFILDQRVEIGRVVRNWLAFLERNAEKEIVFKDIYIFIERLINTFLKLYRLDQTSGRYNFYEYCMRFVYPCILNLEIVDGILSKIAATVGGRNEYAMLASKREYTLFAHFLKLKYEM